MKAPDEIGGAGALDRDRLTALEKAAIWVPQPGPQLAAFVSEADQVLYGGAAGGGKTSLGIGLALTAHRRTLFVRRERAQLGPVVDEIATIVGTRDGLNANDAVWRLPDGRQIQFGGVANLGDEVRYQGSPRDLLVLDEAANILESQARFLLGWLRTVEPGQRCRALICSNPPGNSEGEWLVRWYAPWLDPGFPVQAKPGELKWVAMVDGAEQWVDGPEPFVHRGETIKPISRTFIPSRVFDNRYLADGDYVRQLQALPEPLRSMMLLGSFTAGREDGRFQVIPSAWIRAAQERWRSRRPEGAMTSLGVDVARGGRDRTVLTPRWGTYFGEQIVVPGSGTPDGPSVAALVMQHRTDAALVNIDVIGIGSSVYDHLRGVLGGSAVPMNSAEATPAKDKSGQLGFANRRAEWWWRMREALEPATGEGLAIPPDPGLFADLAAPTWKLTARGVLIELKEDIVKRLGRSPDKGESLVYAFAVRTMPGMGIFLWMRQEAARLAGESHATP
jgi:hypothetical protein